MAKKFERQPPTCKESWEFVRQRPRSNPITDESVKSLALWYEKFGPQKTNDEIINSNAEWLNVNFDISKALNNGGTHIDFADGGRKQEFYTANLYVDRQSGKIFDIDYDDEIDLIALYGPGAVKLEIQVWIDHDEYVSTDPDYQRHQFRICGPEDPRTGLPKPLDELLCERAVMVLQASERVCNSPTA